MKFPCHWRSLFLFFFGSFDFQGMLIYKNRKIKNLPISRDDDDLIIPQSLEWSLILNRWRCHHLTKNQKSSKSFKFDQFLEQIILDCDRSFFYKNSSFSNLPKFTLKKFQNNLQILIQNIFSSNPSFHYYQVNPFLSFSFAFIYWIWGISWNFFFLSSCFQARHSIGLSKFKYFFKFFFKILILNYFHF